MYYQPDNAVLVVAGKFDPDETLGWIAKSFGAIPRPARTLPRLYTRRAGAGRRAQRLAAPRRRHAAGRRPLSHGSGRASGRHRRQRARDDHDRRAWRPPVHGAGRSEEGGRLSRASRRALHDPGFVAFFAQLPLSDSLDRGARHDGSDARGRAQGADHAGGSRSRSRKGVARIRRDDRRPRATGHCACRNRSPSATGGSSSSSATAGAPSPPPTCSASRRRISRQSNRTVGTFVPDAKPDRAPSPPAVDIAAMVNDYKGDPAAATGEVFDATPANLDARTQRFALRERHEGRTAAEKDARRDGQVPARREPGRREVTVRHGAARHAGARTC